MFLFLLNIYFHRQFHKSTTNLAQYVAPKSRSNRQKEYVVHNVQVMALILLVTQLYQKALQGFFLVFVEALNLF